jgi:hypothetical protein
VGIPDLGSTEALAALDKPDYTHFYRLLRNKLKRQIKIVKHPPLPDFQTRPPG